MRPLSRPSVAAESVPHGGCISSVTSHFRHGFLSHPRFFSLLAASVALWQNAVFAQSQDPPSFRTESDVVLVDLVVTDREGNFVSDLKPDEIQLYEDGERQVISFLQHRGRKPRQPTAVKEIVPTLSDGRLKNPSLSQRRDDRYYVFLLDLDTIAHQDLKRVRESIRRFLEAGLTSDDQVMIASLSRGLHVRQNFTSSVPSLVHTLEKLRANPSGVGSFVHFIEEMEELFSRVPPFDLTPQPLQTLPSVVESLVSASVARGRSFLVNLDQQVNTAAASLAALSTRLRSLPGRKQLIFFSGGYPLDAGSVVSRIIEDRAAAIYPNRTPIMLFVNRELRGLGYSSNLRLKLRSAIDQSNRSQVSIYSIDSRGLLAPFDASVRGSGSFSQFSSALAEITAPQEFLISLSLGTGGRSFVDSNDLGEGVRRAFQDRSEYYLVGFVPTAKRRPGAFHSIKVKVNRPRLELRFRRSYIEADKKSLAQLDLLNALKFPHLFQEFLSELQVSTKGDKIQLNTVIPTQALGFAAAEDKYKCVVEIFAALIDGSGKLSQERMFLEKQADLEFSAQQLADFRRHETARIDAEGKAPPGSYDLVVILRQTPSGEMTTHRKRVTVQ